MAHTVYCVKLKKEMQGLDEPPFDNDLGKKVYDNVSQEAWKMWMEHCKMLLNEYRLNPARREDQEVIVKQMEQFFFGEGSAKPKEYVPPAQKGSFGGWAALTGLGGDSAANIAARLVTSSKAKAKTNVKGSGQECPPHIIKSRVTSRRSPARALRCRSQTSSRPALGWGKTARTYVRPRRGRRGTTSTRCPWAWLRRSHPRHQSHSRPTYPDCAQNLSPRRPGPSDRSDSGLSG